MNPGKALAKQLLTRFGLHVSRLDRLEEQIPNDYLKSPFLPRVYKQSMGRMFCFRSMLDRVSHLRGDIVECGVSVGHGILYWALLCELTAQDRMIYGFDSFAGFPPSTGEDKKTDNTFQTQRGDYSSPPELVMKVLEEGRISPSFVSQKVRLVRGFFEKTLQDYKGTIALLHLDCDLYDSYHTCLSSLYSRVLTGGVVLFDEYDDANFPGAKQAVDEFFANKAERVQTYSDLQYTKAYVVKA